MSLEEQLGKLNANLENLITLLANQSKKAPTTTLETRNTPIEEPKKEKVKTEPKTEPKEEPKPEAETTSEGVTFEFLADKVRALAALDREAARAVFASLNVKGLSAVYPKDYVKVDLALTKALNKANAAKEEG